MRSLFIPLRIYLSNMTQFYQLTLPDALTQYRAGFISSAGLLFNYLKIKFAPGWKMRLNQRTICDELGLSKDQFYRGLKLIRQHFPNLKLHRTTALVGEFKLSDEPVVPATNPVVETTDSVVTSTTPVAIATTPIVETATNTPPKPNQTKLSSDSPNYSSNPYHIFINSLSDSQRENFFGFCTVQANLLPNPPVLVKRWISNNWSELRSSWYKKFPDVAYLNNNASSKDWYAHPRFNRWKRRLECQYQAPYFIILLKNGGTEEERKAFAHWAIDNKVVKVPEGVTIEKL